MWFIIAFWNVSFLIISCRISFRKRIFILLEGGLGKIRNSYFCDTLYTCIRYLCNTTFQRRMQSALGRTCSTWLKETIGGRLKEDRVGASSTTDARCAVALACVHHVREVTGYLLNRASSFFPSFTFENLLTATEVSLDSRKIYLYSYLLGVIINRC